MRLHVAPDAERFGVAAHQRPVLLAPVPMELLIAHVVAAHEAEDELDHRRRPYARDRRPDCPRDQLRCRPMIAAFSITPLGVGESVSESVADAVRIVRASGLPNET